MSKTRSQLEPVAKKVVVDCRDNHDFWSKYVHCQDIYQRETYEKCSTHYFQGRGGFFTNDSRTEEQKKSCDNQLYEDFKRCIKG